MKVRQSKIISAHVNELMKIDIDDTDEFIGKIDGLLMAMDDTNKKTSDDGGPEKIMDDRANKIIKEDDNDEQFIGDDLLEEINDPNNKYEDRRQFKCTQCGSVFQQKHLLDRHMKTHLLYKERPFKCEHCERSYLDRTNWSNHMQTHDNERQFKCRLCPAEFGTDEHLTRHADAHHKYQKN